MIKRKTVTTMDVVYVLKRQGRTLDGFVCWLDGWSKLCDFVKNYGILMALFLFFAPLRI